MEAEIEFPVQWHGRLVASSESDLTMLIRSILLGLQLADGVVAPGNMSSQGKYRSYAISATLPERMVMNMLFQQLRSLPGVKMML